MCILKERERGGEHCVCKVSPAILDSPQSLGKHNCIQNTSPPTSNHLGSPQGASIEATWCQISKVAPWQAARLSACVTVTHLQPGSQTLLHDMYDKEIMRYESSISQSCQ